MFHFISFINEGLVCFGTGLVNYCVPAGEADKKALEFTRDINDKVIFVCGSNKELYMNISKR